MDEPRDLRSEPALREAFDIVRRYPVATLVPAVAIGIVVQAIHLLHAHRAIAVAVVGVAGIVAFALYLAYIEEVALEAEAGAEHISIGDTARLLRRAGPVLASVALATAVTGIAMGLGTIGLVVGLWLLTRWSLAIPIIARRRCGARQALRESTLLVRGSFWPVFFTATLAILVEEGTTSLVPLLMDPLTGEAGWGRWLAGAAITSLVMPIAGLIVSATYNRRSEQHRPHLL